MINITNNNIVDIVIGSTPIEKAYIGSQLVWQKEEEIVEDTNGVQYRVKNYIKCNSTVQTYIKLRKISDTDNFEFEVYKTQNTGSWFGSRSGSPVRNHLAIAGYGGGINLNFGYNSPVRIIQSVPNKERYKIRLYNKEIFLNDELIYTCPNNTITTNTVATLGKIDGNTNVCNDRFYYFKWWNSSDVLIYDLIPVQRINDDVWGFFDKVSLTFKPSAGTDQFSGG